MSAGKTGAPKEHTPTKKGQELDKALEDTFPASDPVTVGDETGDEPANVSQDRQTPPIDGALVKKLARELKQTNKG